MTRVAIVEDEKESQKTVLNFLRQYEIEHAVYFDVQCYDDGVKFLEEYKCDFSIVFMDIQLPFINGMEVAKSLRNKDDEVCIVFITNMAQYAVEGYTVQAVGYLVKPITYYQFSVMLEKVLSIIEDQEDTEILLHVEQGQQRISVNEIHYVEVQGHWLTYHCIEGRDIRVRNSMKNAEEQLKGKGFARCNDYYLVNLRYVEKVNAESVLVAGEELRTSRSKRKEFLQELTEYLGGTQ